MLVNLVDSGSLLSNLEWSLQKLGRPVAGARLTIHSVPAYTASASRTSSTTTVIHTGTTHTTSATSSSMFLSPAPSTTENAPTITTAALTSTASVSTVPDSAIVTVSLEVGLRLANVSAFDVEAFQASMAEALGVSPDQLSITSIIFETTAALSLNGSVVSEIVQLAISTLFGVPPENVSSRALDGRRLAFTGVIIEALVRTESASATAQGLHALDDDTMISEAAQ